MAATKATPKSTTPKKEGKTSAKKATTRKKATKGGSTQKVPAPKKPEPEGRKGPDVAGLGEDLQTALARCPLDWSPKEMIRARAIAETLAKGTIPANSKLLQLRDLINEIGAGLREIEQGDDAKALSGLNRLVRRLERSTR